MSSADKSRTEAPGRRAIVITAGYAMLAALWIYASDALLGLVISDPRVMTVLSTYKGWVFVAITASLLYAVLRNRRPIVSADSAETAASDQPFGIWPPLLIFSTFVTLTAAALYLIYTRVEHAATSHAGERLGTLDLPQIARAMSLFGLVLVITAGAATMLWLRQQRAIARLRQLEAERERTALVKHLDYLSRYANDIILLIDANRTIVDANERAVAAYGWPREQLIGMNLEKIRAPQTLAALDAEWQRGDRQQGVMFETVHQRRDGTLFPVEVSSRPIESGGAMLRQSIIRDISERREAEAKILRLSNLNAALSQINQSIVRGHDRDALLADLCRVSVNFGCLEFAWVGMADPATGLVQPVARAGQDADYVRDAVISVDEAHPGGRGPTGRAIRERRAQVCNDFFADPTTVPWRDAAVRAGVRASAAFPIISDDVVVGALNIYASAVGIFDAETVELFQEMTDDVGFALDSISREERRRAAEDALRESEEKYRLLFNAERDAILIFDPSTARIIDQNEAFLELSGYSAAEAARLTVYDLSAEPQKSEEALLILLERGHCRVESRQLRRKDGSQISVELSMNTFEWRGRRLGSTIVRDMSERKRAEENALLWANVLENSSEGIVITDAGQNILTVNKAFTALTGYSAEEVVGKKPAVLASGRHDKAFYHVMWRTINESGAWQGEIWNRRKNGEVYVEWLSITAVRNAAGQLTHYIGVFADITERKELAKRIQFLANHDFLTGLPNRSLMNDLTQQAVAGARRKGSVLAILLIDVDRFKTINDSLGYARGDVLLQRVAARLTSCVRDGDSVARHGGDEFMVLLPDLDRSQDAALMAEKIIDATRRHVMIDAHDLSVTVSIGISVFPNDGNDADVLTRNAEAAMYHAKEHGRNNFQFFTPDMNARAFESLAMEMSLRGAIERSEFLLHYQPQVETRSGSIVGAEALIRWKHQDLGWVSPGRFIPIAEEHGLIVPLGEWVLRTACAQVRAWLDEGLPAVPVAVNMSSVQFRQSGVAATVRQILAESGVPPRYLELELTESIIMREAEQTIAVLRELHEMGVSLAIDDFGTGYSSLSYLRRFPIDKLKIDQSFVSDMMTNPDAAAIAAAIIGMGKSMKLRVIAEGVETVEQRNVLTANQCDELQGYLLARPMEASKFSALLREGKSLIEGAVI